MSLKKKKWSVVAAVLVSLALSAFFSVVQFSSTNIENMVENRETVSFSADQVAIDEQMEEAVIQCEQPVFVENVLIDGELEDELVSVKISYLSSADDSAELQETEAPIELKNSDIYLTVESDVSEMTVELKSETPYRAAVSTATTANAKSLRSQYLV